MTPAFIEAVLDGRLSEAEASLGVVLPGDWPDEHDAGHMRRWYQDMTEAGRLAQWRARAITRLADARMIGHAGFHGPPDDAGMIEVGYTVFPAHRRRGYAGEAVHALLAWAREQGVDHFIASVAPHNEPSLRLVRRLGFAEVGRHWDDEDGEELEFELVPE